MTARVRFVALLVSLTALGAPVAAAAAPRPTLANVALETTSIHRDAQISTNWAGYVVMGADETTTTRFTRVAARWVQPAATCTSARNTYSAFWVGLGGSSDASEALEQIGTEADCRASGAATYNMWYELLPAASVRLKLKVFPGNVVAASVKVSGRKVTLQIRNLTRKTTFTKTVRMATPDLSSAEWIAEAPSACDLLGRCEQLPLSDFGSLAFTRASTTASGHTGTIADPAWAPTTIELISEADVTFVDDNGQTTTGAIPSTLSPDGSAFTIDWQAAISPPSS